MHTFLKQAHVQLLCKVAHCTGHVLQASCVMTGTNSIINFLLIKAAAAYSTLFRNDGVPLPIYIAIGHIVTPCSAAFCCNIKFLVQWRRAW